MERSLDLGSTLHTPAGSIAAIEGHFETPWIEHLSATECWLLVALVEVGRVGVIVDSAPEIYPVNHFIDGDSVVFRTSEGTKLRGLERVPLVCFEADYTDARTRTGWSVLVKGRAVEIVDPHELRQAKALARGLWAIGEKTHWIRVVPDEITGRRLGRGDASSGAVQRSGGGYSGHLSTAGGSL